MEWKNMANIKSNMYKTRKELRKVKQNAGKLRKQKLLNRTSASDIQNKKSSTKTKLNIMKIENFILMWQKINVITNNRKKVSLNTIDIPANE